MVGDKSLESLRFPHIQVLIAKYYLFKSIYVSKWLREDVVTLFVPILITFRMIKRDVFLSFPEQIWSHFRVMRIMVHREEYGKLCQNTCVRSVS